MKFTAPRFRGLIAVGSVVATGLGAGALPSPVPVGGGPQSPDQPYNTPYNGRFTFARLRFTPTVIEGGFGCHGGPDLKWCHDYPEAEHNFMKILREVTDLDPNMAGGNIYTVDDPELSKYPVAYLCEPGFWTMTEKEVGALRAYLLKGGFLIFDDFRDWHWDNFATQMQRVLPEGRLIEIDAQHPIFNAFFKVDIASFPPPYGQDPHYFAIYEDNDPTKRVMVVVNYNNDIGEYWEWSDVGSYPIALTNDAYKIGVNYIMYAMAH